MRVVGLISWWQEADHLLEDCLASLAGLCDHVICLDGRYAAYPSSDVQSPRSNREAILRGAARAHIPCDIHSYGKPWDGPHGGECAKRTHLFRLGELASTEDDWFFVIDGDEAVIEKDGAREKLEETDRVAGLVTLVEPNDGPIIILPQLYRAYRGIVVGPAHYQYTLPDGRRLWCCHNECVPYVDTHHDLTVVHRHGERPEQRDMLRWAYYFRRDTQQIEQPEFDPATLERLAAASPDTTPGDLGVDALAAGPPVAPGLVTARH